MEDTRIRAIEDKDGNLVIEWDDDHPFASIFSEWTEEQWVEAIRLGNERAKLSTDG
jgi:hypothetical protein